MTLSQLVRKLQRLESALPEGTEVKIVNLGTVLKAWPVVAAFEWRPKDMYGAEDGVDVVLICIN